MLKPIDAPTTNGERTALSEVRRESDRMDKLTGDLGDIRVYMSADGKTKYLRIWQGEGNKVFGDTRPLWFEVIPASVTANTPTERK